MKKRTKTTRSQRLHAQMVELDKMIIADTVREEEFYGSNTLSQVDYEELAYQLTQAYRY